MSEASATGAPLAAAVLTLCAAGDVDGLLEVLKDASHKQMQEALVSICGGMVGMFTGVAEILGADPAKVVDHAIKEFGLAAARFDAEEQR